MKKEEIKVLEDLGYVADSSEYRENLIKQLNENSNEKTLKDIQDKLVQIKKNAKKNGQFTREELFKKVWSLEEAIDFYNKNQKKILFNKLTKDLDNKPHTKKRKI